MLGKVTERGKGQRRQHKTKHRILYCRRIF
nr:MAG TPA: hypothetical protein [Caudoviricetes sp.]